MKVALVGWSKTISSVKHSKYSATELLKLYEFSVGVMRFKFNFDSSDTLVYFDHYFIICALKSSVFAACGVLVRCSRFGIRIGGRRWLVGVEKRGSTVCLVFRVQNGVEWCNVKWNEARNCVCGNVLRILNLKRRNRNRNSFLSAGDAVDTSIVHCQALNTTSLYSCLCGWAAVRSFCFSSSETISYYANLLSLTFCYLYN